MSSPPYSENLRDPRPGDAISAEQTRIQNDMLRRAVVLPNSITDSSGTRMVVRPPKATSGGEEELYWCMLKTAHPGRGICFSILIGTWCPDEHKFRFDCSADATESGIDWHYGVPYPDEPYAKGWFKKMPSNWTDSGYIYVCVSLDCDSDEDCAAFDLPCDAPEVDPCGA